MNFLDCWSWTYEYSVHSLCGCGALAETLYIILEYLTMGDSRKFPYSTMGGMNKFNSLAFANSQMFHSPCPLNSKIVIPSSLPDFSFFLLLPSGILVWLPTTSNQRDFAFLHHPKDLPIVYSAWNCKRYDQMHLWLNVQWLPPFQCQFCS